MKVYVSVFAATVLMNPVAIWAQTEPQVVSVSEQTASDVALYPRRFEGSLGTVVIHTPQIDSWSKFENIAARSVISVTNKGSTDATLGVVEFTANTDTNLEKHLVSVEDIQITSVNFPNVPADRSAILQSVVTDTLPARNKLVPLDVVLSYIAPNVEAPNTEGLSFDPPPIFFSDTPAFLVITDGDPILAPIEGTKLKYVVNTNWDLFRYKDSYWYLRENTRWLKSKSTGLDGKWNYTKSLPKDFSKLPEDRNWEVVRGAMPPEKTKIAEPILYTSDRPAELILLKGSLKRRTIGSEGLQYVSNTESDVFILEKDYYYLVSGRWFKAGKLRGPWTFVKELPEQFASIPPNHAKAHVRAAVAGTEEARLATLEAMLPRKATIRRDAGEKITVVYQGDPQFEPIENTTVTRAINSPNDVLLVGGVYYLCLDAVWYLSSTPNGPWTVADSIPAAIYAIPASSEAYHVTHVRVYESNNQTVSTGYTSGYVGTHVSYGVVVYGSGYYYSPYYYYNPYYYGGYPIYYPHPYSYGASSWYNPNTGMYGRSNSVYGPYGGYGRGASYNPKTGTYARGEAAWSGNEGAFRGAAFNPRTGTGIATNRYVNEDGGWGESLVTRGDKWVATESNWDGNSSSTRFEGSQGGTGQIDRTNNDGTVTRDGQFQRGDQSLQTKSIRNDQGSAVGFQTGDGRSGAVGRSNNGDLYAGSNGEVYKRDDNGWQQRNGDSWAPVDVPDERAAQLDQARTQASNKRTEFQQSGNADALSQRRQESGITGQRGTGDSANRTFDQSRRASSEQRQRSTFDQSRRSSTFDQSRRSSTFDQSRRSSLDSGMRRELNRSHTARSSGNRRYNNHQRNSRQRSRPSGGRRGGGGRRR